MGAVYNSNTLFPGDYGEVPAMLAWSNPLNYAKDEIWIGSNAAGSDIRRDGSGLRVNGIDLFANVLAHESEHVAQIQQADAALGQNNGQGQWAAGWSWNVNPNNHTIPDGMGGQTNLDANNNDIPDAWEPYDIEGAAEAMETIPDNTNWQLDWGKPGQATSDRSDI